MKKIILVISLGLIGYGLYIKNMKIFAIGAVSSVLLGTWTLFFEWFESKRKLEEFIRKRGLRAEEGPFDSSIIPDLFYTDFGKIPFSDAAKMIKINEGFRIFRNRYSPYHTFPEYRKSRDSEAFHNSQDNLCFLLKVKQCNGYHRITQKLPLAGLMGKVMTRNVESKLSEISVNIRSIDSNWIIKTSNQGEAETVISSIHKPLDKLNSLFPKNSFTEFDGVTSNIDIHITDNYLFVRTDMKYAAKIEEISNCLKDTQQRLS